MHKNFIWKDKKPKSKHSTLIADYSEGGYKDVDIATKVSAVRVTWITRLLDDNFHHRKVILNLLFLNVGGLKTIFHYNLKLSKYCRQKVSRFPKFYNKLVQIWLKESENEPSQAYDISNEVLWNTCIITFDGESLFNEYFIARGMLTIQDITNENGSFLSWQEAQHNFSLNNSQILHWVGLIKCIPKSWRTKLYSASDNISLANQPRPDKLIVTSNNAYTKRLKFITSPPTSQKSSANSLQLDNVDWRKIYPLPRQTTTESSLRSFQYKILINTLYLKKRLFKFGVAASPLCSQCTQKKESIINLFVTCRVTHNLWEQLCALLSDLDIKLPSPLEPQFLTLGIWNEKLEDSSLVNYLILIFKRYFYLKKNDGSKRYIFTLKASIKNIESVERHKPHKWKIEIPLQEMEKAYASLMNCLTNKMQVFENYFCCLRAGGRDNREGGTGFLFFLF